MGIACACLPLCGTSRLVRRDHLLHVERFELISSAADVVEFALELHPMQTQCVQEAFHDVHAKQHSERYTEPGREHAVEHNAVHGPRHLESHLERFLEEHDRELLVSKRQCPNTQVSPC